MIERIRAYKPLFFEQQDPQTARAYVSEAETKARSYMVSQAVKIWGLDGVALRWKDCQRSPRKSLHLEDKMRAGWDQWDLPAFRKLITANQKDGDHSYGDKLLGSRDGILGHTWRGVSQVLRNAQAHFAHGVVKIDGGQDADPSLASLASYEFAGNIYLYFLSRVRLDDAFGHEVSRLDRKMSEYFSGLIPSSADTQSPSAPITDESESASLDGEPELGPGPIGRVRGAGAVKTSVLAIAAIATVWLCFPALWSAPGGPSETGRTAFGKTVPSLVVADPASTSATTGGGDVSASPIRWVWSRRTVGGRESLKLHWEDRCWSMKQIAGENREESLATFATIQERFRPQAVQKCQLCEAIEADGTRSASGGLPVGVRMTEVPADYAQQIRGELRNWIWSKAVSHSDKEMMLHWKSCKGVGWMKAENQMKATASIEDLSMRHRGLTIQFCPGCYRMEQEGRR